MPTTCYEANQMQDKAFVSNFRAVVKSTWPLKTGENSYGSYSLLPGMFQDETGSIGFSIDTMDPHFLVPGQEVTITKGKIRHYNGKVSITAKAVDVQGGGGQPAQPPAQPQNRPPASYQRPAQAQTSPPRQAPQKLTTGEMASLMVDLYNYFDRMEIPEAVAGAWASTVLIALNKGEVALGPPLAGAKQPAAQASDAPIPFGQEDDDDIPF